MEKLIAITVIGYIIGPTNFGMAACPDTPASNHRVIEDGLAASIMIGPLKKSNRPLAHHTMPNGTLSSVRISLERSLCRGSCPSYSIELRGDGSALYTGKDFVLVTGQHAFEVSPETIQCLLAQFRKADFWSLNNSYIAPFYDSPKYQVTLMIGSHKKSVIDYVGLAVGMPKAVTALEDEIDRIGANRWVYGDSKTLPSLRNEHFDFHSEAAATILANGAASAPDEVLFGLLAEGAPATGRISIPFRSINSPTAIEQASGAGRTAIVQALLAKGAFSAGPSDVREAALRRAASSGNPLVVEEILKYGPNVNAQDTDGNTALINIWRARHRNDEKVGTDIAAVARLLLSAGADPNLQNEEGSTALHRATNADVVQLLVKAGANLEIRNKYGATPLLSVENDNAAIALIEAGADIAAKSNEGKTVEKYAIEYKFTKTLELLHSRLGKK
ncbi:ankyrin repeat domain-containing protein [Beijerinckia indica]|uniref:DUF6438 domain-containing protein n=1 Tax=Beijerinckia indica subsp. indica (strain ATCC 9039 / DSM 1715 / NCIMB 8712) TaxID=395963 RepID=B2IH98_BEII9|nr:ankyrin repeat domain-containing protein [Beijerinckia indica]ACB95883.1 hypothetical protein Bind_2266 [Beijerinckia indica subsp. indica ATCC 9039]